MERTVCAPILGKLQRRECLWNPMLRDYKNASALARAIEKILDDLKEVIGAGDEDLPTEANILAKIRNIRSTHHKELRNIERSERSGAGSADVHETEAVLVPVGGLLLVALFALRPVHRIWK